MAISQWYKQNALLNAGWVGNATCGRRQDLPWTPDSRPSTLDQEAMAAICDECPVIKKCAHHALHAQNGRLVEGGFYAGVWLPWPYSSESDDTRWLRDKGRRQLKNLLVNS